MAGDVPRGPSVPLITRYHDLEFETGFFKSLGSENVVALVFSDFDRIGFCSRLQRIGVNAVDQPAAIPGSVTVLDPNTITSFQPHGSSIILVIINVGRWWRTIGGVAAKFNEDDDMGPQPRDRPERLRAFKGLLTHVYALHVLQWECSPSDPMLQMLQGLCGDSSDQESQALDLLNALYGKAQQLKSQTLGQSTVLTKATDKASAASATQGSPTSEQWPVGCRVCLVGLRREDLNGRIGVVVEKDSGIDGARVGVSIDNGQKRLRMALKPENLEHLVDFFASWSPQPLSSTSKTGAKGLGCPGAVPPFRVEIEGDEYRGGELFMIRRPEGVRPGYQREVFENLEAAVHFANLYGDSFDHDVPCMIWDSRGTLLFDDYTYCLRWEQGWERVACTSP